MDRHYRRPSDFLFSLQFNNHPVKTLLQSEQYTFPEFLSLCGGLLGLFLGVSALSIIELIYHFTLRLYWILRHRRINQIEPSSAQEIESQDESIKRSLLQVSWHNVICDTFHKH